MAAPRQLCRGISALLRSVLSSNPSTGTAAALPIDPWASLLRPFSAAAEAPALRAGSGSDPDRPRSGRREDPGPYVPDTWTYTLTDIPPDTSAARLSEDSKEEMWRRHTEDPEVWTAAKLAAAYKIREQRAHAILWLKELEKKAEEEQGGPLDDEIQKQMENLFGTVRKAAREQHVMIYPKADVDAIEDEGERINRLLQDSKKEEVFKVEEFVRRMNFNKLQMSGKIPVKPHDRKRPEGGWSYLVEELGVEQKRGKGGGRRYVVGPDGTKRGLNDIEKQFVDREKVRRRRRLVPGA